MTDKREVAFLPITDPGQLHKVRRVEWGGGLRTTAQEPHLFG